MPGCHAIALTITLCGAAAYTLQATHYRSVLRHDHEAARSAFVDAGRDPSGSSARPVPLLPPPAEPLTDVYGNEITDAVARYTIDAQGTPREDHSPNTEVSRLRPPTT